MCSLINDLKSKHSSIVDKKTLIGSFISYFNKLGYEKYSYNSIVSPDSNISISMFVNAGIVPLVDRIVVGGKYCSAQPCVRIKGKHSDLELVGNSGHHGSIFGMLGAFNFDGVKVTDTVRTHLAWLESLGLSRRNILLTYHPDLLSDMWALQNDYFLREDVENIWSIDDQNSPLGKCVEAYYVDEQGKELELGNMVFMNGYLKDGTYHSYNKCLLDSGWGVERILSVCVQDRKLGFEINSSSVLRDHMYSVAAMYKSGLSFEKRKGVDYIMNMLLRRGLHTYWTSLSLMGRYSIMVPTRFFVIALRELSVVYGWETDGTPVSPLISILVSELRDYVSRVSKIKSNKFTWDVNNIAKCIDTFGFSEISLRHFAKVLNQQVDWEAVRLKIKSWQG